MARNLSPDCRLCRREGCKLFLKGERCASAKCAFDRRSTLPGQHGAAKKKVTPYGTQFREKQKCKRAYGLLEKEFHSYYTEALRRKGATGDVMMSLLERRLDNVIYRMGIGASRAQSRQIVNHGLINVNGKNVNIPSYQVKAGDVISVKENKKENGIIKPLKDVKIVTPKWLEFSVETLTGKVLALPAIEDIDINIKVHLIIELYSK